MTASVPGMTEGRGFPVRTGGNRTMDEIVRAGRYDGVHSFINQENFPLAPRPQAEVVVELVALGRIATSDEAVAELGMHGLRRPTPEEAVCFGEQHPDAQRHRPVVWPHESFAHEDGSRRLLVHFGGTGYRSLDLYVDSAWGAYCVFAGVREQERRMRRDIFTGSRREAAPARP